MLHFFARRMKVLHNEDRKGEKGFTLIELLVVVIIIGILAAIAIPVFLNQMNKGREAAAQSDLRNLSSAATACSADNNGSFANCNTLEKLQAPPYNFKKTDAVEITNVTGDAAGFNARAKHEAGGRTFEFTTASGQVKPVATT